MLKTIRRQRNVLTKDQAIEIFAMRIYNSDSQSCLGTYARLSALTVASKYGVSAKAVRDSWNARTWYRETLALQPLRADVYERSAKAIGRPKGAKDRKPRKRQIIKFIQINSANKQNATPCDSSTMQAKAATKQSNNKKISAVQTSSTIPKSIIQPKPIQHKQVGSPANSLDIELQTLSNHASQIDMSNVLSLGAGGEQGSGYSAAEDFGDPFHDDWPHWPPETTRRSMSSI